jgi:hypothetical protein
LQIAIDILLKRLRRHGHAIKAVRKGPGQSADRWTVGDCILNGRGELERYARGVGALGHEYTIGSRQLRPDERAAAKEKVKGIRPVAMREDATQCAERFAQTLTGLLFDLSYEGQRDIWREALRVSPVLAETTSYRRFRDRNVDRIASEFLGIY